MGTIVSKAKLLLYATYQFNKTYDVLKKRLEAPRVSLLQTRRCPFGRFQQRPYRKTNYQESCRRTRTSLLSAPE